MNWTQPPATENLPDSSEPRREPHATGAISAQSSQPQAPAPGTSPQTKVPGLRIGKSLTLAPIASEPNREVFTLTLGEETIELLPFKNWIQLDHFKWTVRGKLPAEPAGLEIFPDHLRLMGETVALNDPEDA